jgi:hypothetical protein
MLLAQRPASALICAHLPQDAEPLRPGEKNRAPFHAASLRRASRRTRSWTSFRGLASARAPSAVRGVSRRGSGLDSRVRARAPRLGVAARVRDASALGARGGEAAPVARMPRPLLHRRHELPRRLEEAMSVPAQELAVARDRVARARLERITSGRPDLKGRSARVGVRRPSAAASQLPPLPLEPSPLSLAVAVAALDPSERAIAARLLASCAGAEVAAGFDLEAHIAAVARTVAHSRGSWGTSPRT